MLKSTENKGFQLTFTNGYTISVQFGRGNYCMNRNTEKRPMTEDTFDCRDAEVAVWDAKGAIIELQNGYYALGWLSADEVAQWIDKVSKF